MILFEIDSQGYVRSTPSLIPQGMSLSDIVIITESDYELVTLRLIPPSGRYIPDVVCTPVKTQNKSATLWQAILPAEAAAMHGVLTYQIFRRNVQGRVIPTQEGALTVQRGVISDMPESVEHLGTYSIDSLYHLLTAIHAKTEDHDRGIDKNASDITANATALTALTARIDNPAHGLSAVEHKIDNFLYGVTDEARDQLSEVLGLISANADAIETFKNMGGAPVGSGTLVVPASEWSDSTPTGAMIGLPANTMGAGSVMLLTPANDATKEAASKARLTVSVDISGDSGGNVKDYVVLLRAETAAKPAIDMEFAYVILQTTATTSLVTLIGVDAAGGTEPTLVDLSRFEGALDTESGLIKGYITEVFGEGEDAPTKVTEVVYDEDGNIIKIGNTAINWGGEA